MAPLGGLEPTTPSLRISLLFKLFHKQPTDGSSVTIANELARNFGSKRSPKSCWPPWVKSGPWPTVRLHPVFEAPFVLETPAMSPMAALTTGISSSGKS